ncbi:MAG: hypothetical protein KDA75_08935, partial [Planctomycetaceae bacterium]|nr:hypothetical protein [Planctomycetaceae bacterium]
MLRRKLSWLQVLCVLGLLSTAAAQTYSRLAAVDIASKSESATDREDTPVSAAVAADRHDAAVPDSDTGAGVEDAILADVAAAGPWKPWYSLVSSDGYLAAKFSAVSPDYAEIRPARASDVVLTRQGAVIGMAKVGPGGVAQIGGVRDGQQGLIVRGADGFA